jgi:hypothetical protein
MWTIQCFRESTYATTVPSLKRGTSDSERILLEPLNLARGLNNPDITKVSRDMSNETSTRERLLGGFKL